MARAYLRSIQRMHSETLHALDHPVIRRWRHNSTDPSLARTPNSLREWARCFLPQRQQTRSSHWPYSACDGKPMPHPTASSMVWSRKGFPHLHSFVSVVIAASGMFSGDGERLLVRRQIPSVKAKLCSVVRVPDGVILKTVPALLAPPLNVVP